VFLSFIIFETLTNAVKYQDWTLENNTVIFEVRKLLVKPDSFLVISISNLLSKEDKISLSDHKNLSEIFDKGKRAGDDKTTSGTGLGLYIIRNIIEKKFRGKIEPIINESRLYINCYLNLEYL